MPKLNPFNFPHYPVPFHMPMSINEKIKWELEQIRLQLTALNESVKKLTEELQK